MRKFFAAASAAIAVTACSSGTQGVVPARSATTYPATFVMHWPAVTTQGSRRRPHFISPSTQSVAIEVNDNPSLTTIANNPSTGQPATSHLTIMAPPGNDAITFSLYDHTGATGNELGQVTVTQKIVPAQNNTISATVDGIVASVELDPLPNQSTLSSSTDSTGAVQYAIAGDLPVTFAAKSKDADGNIILASGATVSYSVTSTTDTLAVTPVSGQSNQFSVRLANAPVQGRATGLVAHATDQLGNIAQTNYPVSLTTLTYIAYQNTGAGTIVALDGSGKSIALPGSFSGVTAPLSLVYDPADHRIYVLDGTTSKVLAFNTDGTPVSGFTSPAVSGATSLTFDHNDNCIYVASSSNTISVFNSDGSNASVAGTWPGLQGPVAIDMFDAGTSPLIFVANATNNTVSKYHEDGTPAFSPGFPSYTFSTGTLQPTGIATDAVNGAVVVSGSDSGVSELSMYGPIGGQITTQTGSVSSPAGVFYNSSNANYYVANSGSNDVTVYDEQLAGLLSTIAPPAGLSKPVAVTFVF